MIQIDDIRRVLIVGAGTMGQEIGLQCAMHGYDVTLYDTSAKQLDRARTRHEAILRGFLESGNLTDRQVRETLDRLSMTTDAAEAAHEADLLSESVPEDPKLKGEVLGQFDALCPARTIFTTNTSTLVPSLYAEATGRPTQFAAYHFHHEVWVSNVVDIMPHADTDPAVVDLLYAFSQRIGQIPIVCETESYGYVFNAMFNGLLAKALTLGANGIASVEDIDRAWMGVMKMPLGPYGMMDSIGLDTVWKITDYWGKMLRDRQTRKNAKFLKQYVDEGKLGIKSGEGFYSYPAPTFQQPGFLMEDTDEA